MVGDDVELGLLAKFRAARPIAEERELRGVRELAEWFAREASARLDQACYVFAAWDPHEFPAAVVSTAGLASTLATNRRVVSVDGFVAADLEATIWFVIDFPDEPSMPFVANVKLLETAQ